VGVKGENVEGEKHHLTSWEGGDDRGRGEGDKGQTVSAEGGTRGIKIKIFKKL